MFRALVSTRFSLKTGCFLLILLFLYGHEANKKCALPSCNFLGIIWRGGLTDISLKTISSPLIIQMEGKNITVKEWKSLNFYLSYLSGKALWIIKIYSIKLWTLNKVFSCNFYSSSQICIINKKSSDSFMKNIPVCMLFTYILLWILTLM